MERLSYALIGAVLGSVLGIACWWLYGLALSGRYAGPGIDPAAIHWVKLTATLFAVLGFIFKEKVGTAVGAVLATIFHFEAGTERQSSLSWWQVLAVVGIIAFVFWYVVR